MENFLSGRTSIVKLPSVGDKPVATVGGSGGGFSPMFGPKAEPAAVVAASGASTLPASLPPAPEPATHTHDVRVELVRIDGAVQGIVVTCKCGERIELDCVY